MKSLSLTLEKVKVCLKVFLRIQTSCIWIISTKNKLGAHSVRGTTQSEAFWFWVTISTFQYWQPQSKASLSCLCYSAASGRVPLTGHKRKIRVNLIQRVSLPHPAQGQTADRLCKLGPEYTRGGRDRSSALSSSWSPDSGDSLVRQMSSGILCIHMMWALPSRPWWEMQPPPCWFTAGLLIGKPL